MARKITSDPNVSTPALEDGVRSAADVGAQFDSVDFYAGLRQDLSTMGCAVTGAGHGLLSSEIVAVPLDQLRFEGSPRTAGENSAHVGTLAQLADSLPPIVVHRQTMAVIDGLHRVRVAQGRGAETIDAVYFDGDEMQAFVLAVRMNSAHGLPLSLADRKAAAQRLVSYYPEWSNRRLAEVVGLSDKTIATVRKEVGAENPRLPGERMGRDGIAYPSEAGAASRRALEYLDSNPDASAREVALATGISHSTAKKARRDVREGRVIGAGRPAGSGVADRADSASLRLAPGEKVHGHGGLEDPRALVQRLRADPSLRFTENGRRLLRTLDAVLVEPATWEFIVDSLPVHCAPLVAKLARQNSENWQNLAKAVTRRADLNPIASNGG